MYDVVSADMRCSERTGQLGQLMNDNVGFPLLGPWDELDGALRGGIDEYTRRRHLQALLRWEGIEGGLAARNDASDSARLGGTSQVSKPQRSTSGANSAPVAKATSWPSRCAARASGSIGLTCP
jgi:hypothetical protein